MDHALRQNWAAAIKQTILSLADEYTPKPGEIGDNDPILELGLLDSAGVVALLAWYEDRFGIELAPEEVTVEHLGTVSAMVDLAERKGGRP